MFCSESRVWGNGFLCVLGGDRVCKFAVRDVVSVLIKLCEKTLSGDYNKFCALGVSLVGIDWGTECVTICDRGLLHLDIRTGKKCLRISLTPMML